MTNPKAQSIGAIQGALGERIRDLRVRSSLTQAELASRANIAIKSVQALEAGAGSKLSTLISVMKVLGIIDELDLIAPRPSVSPMALLKQQRRPGRVYLGRRYRHNDP